MAERTITSSNSVFMLAIVGVFSVPQRLQGYSTDAAWSTEEVEEAEIAMGIDGRLSAGFTPVAKPMTVTLQADSASNVMFEQWIAAQKTAREITRANATINAPSLQRQYTCIRGVLTRYPPTPEAAKTMRPRVYTITWEDIQPAPL